jgi:hypothetical protein
MKTTLKLVAVAVAVLGLCGSTKAAVIDYFLHIDPTGPGTWELRASTDMTGGIASIAVELVGANMTGSSLAPRTNFVGFGTGNLGTTAVRSSLGADNTPDTSDDVWGNWEGSSIGATPNITSNPLKKLFSGQNTGSVSTLVYQIGRVPVPDSAFFGPGFVGNANVVPVTFYAGTYTGTAPVFAPNQPANFGAAWPTTASVTPTGAPTLTATYTVVPVPEPGTIVLIGLAVPALALAIRRRKA